MADKLVLHEDPCSGNCYKIKLTAALLGLPLETRQYDILKGETRTPEFLSTINANGRIPVLQIGEGEPESRDARFLPESNAACWFLASGSYLVPETPFEQADTLRWMFFEQYNHEPNVATMRFWMKFVGEANLSAEQRAQLPIKRANGEEALALLDRELADRPFLCGDTVTLADLVLFPYTHKAEEGGFSLESRSHVRRWIERIESLEGFIFMD
ncbi:MAG: glutathione S-transferase family protein [Pseudomonadota bacterium]